jgi:predicted O-methyltransferase YrrM
MENFSHQSAQVEATLVRLYKDAKYDRLNMIRGAVRNVFGPLQPADFATAYLSISREQGIDLERLITENNLKNVVEFGTSFGISTLFLAKGVLATGGQVITTELIESKGRKARENFKNAGVADLIEVRIGDALETIKDHAAPHVFLLLDGCKDLYFPLFQLL